MIRKLIYNNQLNKQLIYNAEYKKYKYIALRAYINRNYNHIFIQLFPQFSIMYDEIEIFINYICQEVSDKYISNITPNNKNKLILYIRNKLQEVIGSHTVRASPKIVRDFIIRTDMLDVLYRYLYIQT